MNKVNERRKQMYLNGEVGVEINNSSTVNNSSRVLIMALDDTLSINTKGKHAKGNLAVPYHPLSWFFEQDEPQTEPRTPTAWRLNIDVPEYQLSEGDKVDEQLCPKSILKHISTPIYTTLFMLESWQVVELSDNDIDNIKKL